MLIATKVRLYPKQHHCSFLNEQFGAVRFVRNKALFLKSHAYRFHGLSLDLKKDIKPLLAVAKRSRKYQWLKQYDSIALQQAVINLDKAFKRFFDPTCDARFPRFKSKRGKQSSYHCTGIKVLDGAIKIPKLDPIPARLHRPLEGTLKSITVSRTVTGKYYASILMETGEDAPVLETQLQESQVLGLDMGLTHVMIDSTGHKEANPRFLTRAAKNLKRKQQALSRKQKGSKGRAKARLQVAKCHEKLANARNDFQHKRSTQLIDDNQAVIVETLKIKNMMKNRKLAKHIADAAWHGLIQKLRYKAERQGKHLVKIDQWYASSKMCSRCGHKVEELDLSIRHWTCPACFTLLDRDINAAINVKRQGIIQLKAAGLVVSADGGSRKTRERLAAA